MTDTSGPTRDALKILDFHPEYFWATCQQGNGRYILDCGNRDANARLQTFVETVQANIDAHTQALREENALLRDRLRLAVELVKAWKKMHYAKDNWHHVQPEMIAATNALRASGVDI